MEDSKHSRFIQFLRSVSRSKSDKVLGGVCGGFAEHSAIPAWVFRVLFTTLSIFWGFGLLAYIALWVCMPVEETSVDGCKSNAPSDVS